MTCIGTRLEVERDTICTVDCVVPFSDRKEPGNEARLACRLIFRMSTLSQDFTRETFVLHATKKLA